MPLTSPGVPPASNPIIPNRLIWQGFRSTRARLICALLRGQSSGRVPQTLFYSRWRQVWSDSVRTLVRWCRNLKHRRWRGRGSIPRHVVFTCIFLRWSHVDKCRKTAPKHHLFSKFKCLGFCFDKFHVVSGWNDMAAADWRFGVLGDLRRLHCCRELNFWATQAGWPKQITCRQCLPKVCVQHFHGQNKFQIWIFWVFFEFVRVKD